MLIRPKPKAQESLQSYILRSCRANKWKYEGFKTHVTKHIAPLHSSKLNDRGVIAKYLQAITGFEQVSSLIDVWSFIYSYRSYFDLARNKICPTCYQGGNEAPAYWFFNSYLTCVKHKTLMVDSCWNCERAYCHNSLINLKCSGCFSSIFGNEPKEVQIDKYSQKIFALFTSGTPLRANYISKIDNTISSMESELSLLKSLMNSFSRGTDTRGRHSRRQYTIAELHQKQLSCSKVAESKSNLNKKMTAVIAGFYQGGYRDIGKMIAVIRSRLAEDAAKPVVNGLKLFILNPPSNFNELKISVKLLEQLFEVKAGTITALLKAKFSKYIVVAPGALSILVINADELVQASLTQPLEC